MAGTEPSLADEPRRVSITSNGIAARVLLDRTDVTRHVSGYTLEQRPGAAPVLMLHAQPTGGAVFEGLAHVAVVADHDPAETIASFLQSIDPRALESTAIERDDLDGERYALTAAMLRQLVDWARGV